MKRGGGVCKRGSVVSGGGGGGGGGGGSKRRCFLISHTDRDPFPRLPSQSVRCKTCCESIQTATATHTQPAALAPAANAASSLSLGGDNSNRGETATNADRDRSGHVPSPPVVPSSHTPQSLPSSFTSISHVLYSSFYILLCRHRRRCARFLTR